MVSILSESPQICPVIRKRKRLARQKGLPWLLMCCTLIPVGSAKAACGGAEVFEAICVLERAAGREGTGNDVEHLVHEVTAAIHLRRYRGAAQRESRSVALFVFLVVGYDWFECSWVVCKQNLLEKKPTRYGGQDREK